MNESAETIREKLPKRNIFLQRFKTAEQRFFEKVEKTGDCWNWTAKRNTQGYGVFHYPEAGGRAKRTQRAHRVSWIFRHGAIPDGLDVLHVCDNPSCVNPDHLFLGTDSDNAKDKAKKGRSVHHNGSKNGNSKLTEESVRQIRNARARGMKLVEIASMFDVDFTNIGHICSGRTWRHIN